MDIALIYTDEDNEAFGPRSISAVLKEAGYRTRLILMKSKEKIYSGPVLEDVNQLAAEADVIGISCFSRASEKAIQILEHLRPLGKVRVWGGIHATLNPEACVDHADVVCRGEGEGFMLELAEKLSTGGNWRDIANAAYRENGRTVLNGLRPLIADLDELPLMDYSFDDEYRLKNGRLVRVLPSSGGSEPISFNGTRGCDFDCTYCSNARLKELACSSGRYARAVSVTKLIEHAENLKRRFPGAKCFDFFDEDFCARTPEQIRQFSEAYTRRIGLPFGCMVSPLRMSEEKMDLLVKAGLWRINVGVESGSERTKKEIYNRCMSNEAVLRAVRIINKYPHVVPYYFFIIGNPYEERDDLNTTVRFIGNLPPPFFLRTYNLVFIPGTLLYQTAVKDGTIGGIQDSGFELDFVGGLNYRRHTWKKKNLYLNGLLYLMSGKITRRRLGLVPRPWLGALLRPGTVAFHERNTVFIRCLILLKLQAFRLRALAAIVLKRLFNDPTSIYDLKNHVVSLVKKSRPAIQTTRTGHPNSTKFQERDGGHFTTRNGNFSPHTEPNTPIPPCTPPINSGCSPVK